MSCSVQLQRCICQQPLWRRGGLSGVMAPFHQQDLGLVTDAPVEGSAWETVALLPTRHVPCKQRAHTVQLQI